jgi:hypothetical protein
MKFLKNHYTPKNVRFKSFEFAKLDSCDISSKNIENTKNLLK